YFPDIEMSNLDDLKEFEVSNYSILTPYIVGFNNSRPSKPKEFSEPARLSNELLRYWHPDYKNVPMQKYRHEFDYYSLGIVLLEIGLWSPLSALTRNLDKQEPAEFARAVRESLCPLLRSSVGSIYEDVVINLLEAAYWVKDGMAKNDPTPLGQLIQFQAQAL